MSDLIRRENVLDALRNLAFEHTFQFGEYYGENERQLTIINAEKAIDVIESLPSVEPEPEPEEFEWCHDCKEYDQDKHCCHRWTKVIRQTVEDMKSAELGRKTGRWIEVYGYATPGGDPVWKCSECGKGMHVYGIEAPSYNRDYADGQWVACPNCGAIMEDI